MFSSAVGAALLTQFKGHVQLKVVRCFGNMLWLKTAWQGLDIILFNLVSFDFLFASICYSSDPYELNREIRTPYQLSIASINEQDITFLRVYW